MRYALESTTHSKFNCLCSIFKCRPKDTRSCVCSVGHTDGDLIDIKHWEWQGCRMSRFRMLLCCLSASEKKEGSSWWCSMRFHSVHVYCDLYPQQQDLWCRRKSVAITTFSWLSPGLFGWFGFCVLVGFFFVKGKTWACYFTQKHTWLNTSTEMSCWRGSL